MPIWNGPREAARALMARGVRHDVREGTTIPNPEPPKLDTPDIVPPEMPEVHIGLTSPSERVEWHVQRPELASDDDLMWARLYLAAKNFGIAGSAGVAASSATDLILPQKGAGPKIPKAGLFGAAALLGGLVSWAKGGGCDHRRGNNAEGAGRQVEPHPTSDGTALYLNPSVIHLMVGPCGENEPWPKWRQSRKSNERYVRDA